MLETSVRSTDHLSVLVVPLQSSFACALYVSRDLALS